MTSFKRFATLLLLGSILLAPNQPARAAQSTACSPIDPKPTKLETRLGTISIDTDIIAVGQPLTIMVANAADANNVSISTPLGTEVLDYFPKTVAGVTVAAGAWTAGTSQVPAGDYTLTVKPTQWTNGKWIPVDYSIGNGQGQGIGQDSFFAFYDKVAFTLSLDSRNQAPQATRDVVRKVTVDSPAGIAINLSSDKGSVGTSISTKQGNQAVQTATSSGKTNFFLFAGEGDKVKLTVSSTDTCTNSSVTKQFTVGVSDTARTYQGTSLLDFWWVGLLLLVIVIVFIFMLIKKRKPAPAETLQSIATQPIAQSATSAPTTAPAPQPTVPPQDPTNTPPAQQQ